MKKSVIMLFRKIEKYIVTHLESRSDKILIVDGARQIGKSYIIREVGKKLFPNYIEINMETDKLGDRTFADAKTVKDGVTYLPIYYIMCIEPSKANEEVLI